MQATITYTNGQDCNISKKQITGSINRSRQSLRRYNQCDVNGSLNGLITGDQVNLNAQGQFVIKMQVQTRM
jgi:hypothetical protein